MIYGLEINATQIRLQEILQTYLRASLTDKFARFLEVVTVSVKIASGSESQRKQ